VTNIPKIDLLLVLRGWIALVLAVSYVTDVHHVKLLRHSGRTSKRLCEARRLLLFGLIEALGGNHVVALSWLEELLSTSRRTVSEWVKGDKPERLKVVLLVYAILYDSLSSADVDVAIAAGLLGQRMFLAAKWPRSLFQRLGLKRNQVELEVLEALYEELVGGNK